MEVKQNPFSLYDFLGYFIPGASALFLFSFVLNRLGVSTGIPPFESLADVSQLLPFVLFAFLTGHVIALLSSVTVERYYIWSFGYPSKSLLRITHEGYFHKIEKAQAVTRILIGMFMLPVSILDIAFSKAKLVKSDITNQIDPLLTRIIRRKISCLIVDVGQVNRPNDYAGPKNSDFFRLVYHYVLENAPAHCPKMQNYVALFGFSRSLCFIFISLFWISLITLLVDVFQENAWLLLGKAWLFSLIFFLGFAKFYRRYSLEALMALAATYRIPDHVFKMKIPKSRKPRE